MWQREIWKIKILKSKKTPRDIIILHICTINYNHMMYGSCDMECNRQNFLSFWTIFCPFTCQWTQKIKIKKKKKKNEKNAQRYHHFTQVHHKWQSWCMVPEVWSVTGRILSFWTVFCPFTHLTTWKIKIFKKWNLCLELLSFYTCAPYMKIIWCLVP